MDNEIRVQIEKEEQIELFRKFLKKFNKDNDAAKFLGISKYSLSRYKNNKTRYIPEDILKKVVNYLGINLPLIREYKTLGEIRNEGIIKATKVLKNKYGSEFRNVLQKGSKLALEKKYGKDAYRIISKRGFDSSKLKYGDDWRAQLSKKGIDSLKSKYGKRWFDVILKKGREILKSKYGLNWQKKLSDIGRKSHNKKYIDDFNKAPTFHKSIFAKRKPTSSEQFVIDYLNKNNIPFESNVFYKDIELDIIIPNRNNPRYIIEVSDAKPTTYNQRKKILQLYYQKKLFPQAQIIALLKTRFSNNKGNLSLHKITKVFLDQEKITSLSLQNIKDYIPDIVDSIKKNADIKINEKFIFSKLSMASSKKGSLTQSKRINLEESQLHNLLLEIGASPSGAFSLEVKDNAFICLDNFEDYNGKKIAYEINSSRSYNSLRALAGKILLCKKFRPEIKFIVILTNASILNNTSFSFLSDIADKVILNRNFNRNYLIDVRTELTS